MIKTFQGISPNIANSAFIDDGATVIGDVTIGEDASLWSTSVVRGDVGRITIGSRTNIQEGCILHVTHDSKFSPGGYDCTVGEGVTAGHRVTIHACEIGNYCLLGMSSTIMDGAVLEDRLILGAGALVPIGRRLSGGYLYLGSPAKQIRQLTDEESEFLEYSATHYVELKNRHKDSER